MKVQRHILYLLTLYVHAITANEVTSYQVNALNHIFSNHGWTDLSRVNNIMIVVRTPEGYLKLLTVNHMLAAGSVGQIVTKENAENKICQLHGFFSCMYANVLETCYDYTVNAIAQCKKIVQPSETLKCVGMVLDMFRKIDPLVLRMRGTFLCIYQLFPRTQFIMDVSIAMEDLKSHYDNLTYDSESPIKEYHDAIVNSLWENVFKALERLSRFYDTYCRPVLYRGENGMSQATIDVHKLEGYFPSIDIVGNIQIKLNRIVDENLIGFDYLSLGFEYDSNLKTTRIMYNP